MSHTKQSRLKEMAKRRVIRKEWFDKNGPCKNCGSKIKLHAHHLNPKNKISHNVWSWSKEKRKKELLKCIVLCEKCHLWEHHRDKIKPLVHGTMNAYNKKGCRCILCKKVNAERGKRNRHKRLKLL